MLKGIQRNILDNYSLKIKIKKNDQLKSKKDVNISEAFELYMLKNYLNIKLNKLTEKMLSFWEAEFESTLGKHKDFLKYHHFLLFF